MKLHWNCFVKPQLQSARPVHMISNCPILIKSGIDKCEAHFIVVKSFCPFIFFVLLLGPLPLCLVCPFLCFCHSAGPHYMTILVCAHFGQESTGSFSWNLVITTLIFHLLITADYSTWHCLNFQNIDILTYSAVGMAKILQRSDFMSEKSRFLIFVTFFDVCSLQIVFASWHIYVCSRMCFGGKANWVICKRLWKKIEPTIPIWTLTHINTNTLTFQKEFFLA